MKKRVHLKPHGHGGHVTRQHTVWCFTCHRFAMEDGPQYSCEHRWREAGWRKTKTGWQCPSCRRELGVLRRLPLPKAAQPVGGGS